MAYINEEDFRFHDGEEQMHRLLRTPHQENPTSTFLTPGGSRFLQTAPLLAVGTLDAQGRPWSTVWGGEPGFSRAVGKSIVGIKLLVDRKYDPVVESLLGGNDEGKVIEEEGRGRMVSGLTIDLEKRTRIKWYGRMVAGAVSADGQSNTVEAEARGEVQLIVKVEQSLGNCPKYMNRKHIYPSLPEPKLISDSPQLPEEALELIQKADALFISSSNYSSDMDTNYRGGPPGFVRIISNEPIAGTVLVYPEYSGNRLYQTLGNLQNTPLAGLVFPDFDTGNVLYVTGATEILIGKDAALLLARSNLAIKITITAARFVRSGLAFRGEPGERSPYNPPVRFLAAEHALSKGAIGKDAIYAKLIKKEALTPTISRFRFSLSDAAAAGKWKPGQYVALSFEDELNLGYSHMRDDDPKSLNDDYLRTFTVSSAPGVGMKEDEFEITIRKVGVVTNWLFRQKEQYGIEVPLKGFGGEFRIETKGHDLVAFVAGGIGITPLLAQLPELDLDCLQLFWTVGIRDVGLVIDAFRRFPELPNSTTIFLTGAASIGAQNQKAIMQGIDASCIRVHNTRMAKQDLLPEENSGTSARKWYVCTGTGLRKTILEWLNGKEVVYEDFNY